VGSIERRIQALEAQFVPPEDEGEQLRKQLRKAILVSILNEFSSLKACRARNAYRGGSPPTPIQPTDPAGEALGYPYTTGQLTAFAVRRVIERDFAPKLDLGEGEVEDAVEAWVQHMRTLGEQAAGPDSREEIDAEGPPGKARPWH
jgi:hypothetical protein